MINNESSFNIIIPLGFNMFLGITNRLLQIIDYILNRYKIKNYGFQTDDIQHSALVFCIMPTIVSAFMMGLYCIFHYEEKMTPKIKIINFFSYIFSIEILFPMGVHKSLITKYSSTADNPLYTLRLVNAVHFMFVAFPQLLIVSINGSAKDKGLQIIDIMSLVFSCLFMIWSVGYYFICISFDDQYEDLLIEYAEKSKDD